MPISSLKDWSNGGMVDARDLKSLGPLGCAGSSPASTTNTEIRENQGPVRIDHLIVNRDRDAQRLNRCSVHWCNGSTARMW